MKVVALNLVDMSDHLLDTELSFCFHEVILIVSAIGPRNALNTVLVAELSLLIFDEGIYISSSNFVADLEDLISPQTSNLRLRSYLFVLQNHPLTRVIINGFRVFFQNLQVTFCIFSQN